MEINPTEICRKVYVKLYDIVEKVMKNRKSCGNCQQSGGVDEEDQWADEDSDLLSHIAVCFAYWVDSCK
ncbi:hypothetical protein LBYZC6_34320 [Lacrimispora brassicae]